jgi:hypothetical protein
MEWKVRNCGSKRKREGMSKALNYTRHQSPTKCQPE